MRDLEKRQEHLKLLSAALLLNDINEYARDAFEQMFDIMTTEIDPPRGWVDAGPVWQRWALTEKEENWVRRELGEEIAESDTRFTDGPVPRGKEVEMAEVLKRPLPMKPPGRK